jgi:uncharacterized protein YbjT (DUF2867 family)
MISCGSMSLHRRRCSEQKGIRRVVHISAVGAGPSGATAFARTKGETESDLSSRDLDWVILRPSLVVALGVFGGTALLRGAASIPFLTPIPAAKPIHIVAIEDFAETVAWALGPDAPSRISLDLVHPEPTTLAAIVVAYRGWLGLKQQPVVTLPRQIIAVIAWVADALSWLGWRSPMRTTAITQLADGINGDPTGWIAATRFSASNRFACKGPTRNPKRPSLRSSQAFSKSSPPAAGPVSCSSSMMA